MNSSTFSKQFPQFYTNIDEIELPKYFLNYPIVSPLPDGELWVVIEDIQVDLRGFGHKIITIPKGYTFDFASIPWYSRWWLQPATGLYRYAAIVHDYLYVTEELPKDLMDLIFYTLMVEHGVYKIKAFIMYESVNLFGPPFKRRK